MALSVSEIVEGLVSEPAQRREIWALALNRGMGEGMQIEKWLLVEMLAQLQALQREGVVSDVEGECKYPVIKSSRYEHCDFWWRQNRVEHWLEVKTIVIGEYQWRGNMRDIEQDLEKRHRLEESDLFHHLAVVFPMREQDIQTWRQTLDPIYSNAEMAFIHQWKFPLWQDKKLLMVLYSE